MTVLICIYLMISDSEYLFISLLATLNILWISIYSILAHFSISFLLLCWVVGVLYIFWILTFFRYIIFNYLFYFMGLLFTLLFVLMHRSFKIWHNPSLLTQLVKNLSAMQESAARQETQVRFLGLEDPWRRKWQPTPVFLTGKPHGQRSLSNYSPQGHKNWTQVGN